MACFLMCAHVVTSLLLLLIIVGCLQAKFRHFGKVDAAKYSQLWRLQQQEACGLVKQLLAADRVILEQQLGWQWVPPDEGIFVSPHDVTTHTGAGVASSAAAAAAAGVATLTISAAGAAEGEQEEGEQEQQMQQQEEQVLQRQQGGSEAGARVSQDGAASARSRSSSGSSPGGATGRHNGPAEVSCASALYMNISSQNSIAAQKQHDRLPQPATAIPPSCCLLWCCLHLGVSSACFFACWPRTTLITAMQTAGSAAPVRPHLLWRAVPAC
jgi:hypothetical protein